MSTKKSFSFAEARSITSCSNTSTQTGAANGPQPGIWDDPGHLDQVPVAQVATPGAWGEVSDANFPHALFVNHFNTDIKGATGWTVGYLDETVIPYSTSLDSITCNQIQNNFKYLPVAQNNIIGWTNGSNEGYYQGSTSTHDFEIYRIVAITNGSVVFLIKVTAQNVGMHDGGKYWTSNIVFEYKCFDCTVPTTNPNEEVLPFLKKLMNV